ncbi:MAG TPA: AAA family ATPase [Bacillota bacterium]|nr:AAA family ATPase [Bacillota bacterium]
MSIDPSVLKAPLEVLWAKELAALKDNDYKPKPPGWLLSPQAVREFIIGSNGRPLTHNWEGQKENTTITRKFYGDETLIDRCIVTLMGNRGLLLVGEPGTAKSMLSELLAAAISGVSTNTIQGTAGTTEDQVKYSWNYALLLNEGPSLRSLVPAPVFTGITKGLIVRFEELTRCAPEVQDCLISVLSEKVVLIPEFGDEQGVFQAKKGFNIIATANIRDRGVHEMSSALKRRFNFETVMPIADKAMEMELVKKQTVQLLNEVNAKVDIEDEVIDLLVTTFQDLRNGKTEEGTVIDRPSTVMSTAEAIAVGFSACLDASYFGNGNLESAQIAKQLVGTVLKDNPEDAKKLRHYFDVVVKARSRKNHHWKSYYDARKWLP